ncbi:MAG: hypothetical protein ACLFVH_04970 [Phycisphaerae bacterium]
MAVTHPVLRECERTARRLMMHRIAESVAVTAALVGPLAAWLAGMHALAMRGQASWALVGAQVWVVWVAVLLQRRVRTALSVAPMQMVLAIIAGTGLYAGTMAGVLLGEEPTGWWLAARGLGVVAVVGPVTPLVRGVSVRQAAVWLDHQLHAGDRIATAVEKLTSDGPIGEEAALIAAQAENILSSRQPTSGGYWRRTRRTAALAGLAVGVCLLVGALGPASTRDAFSARLADAAAELDESQRRRIARAMRAAARSSDAAKAELLREAAVVMVDASDRDRLAELLRELRRRGYDVRRDVPEGVMEELARRAGGGGDETADRAGNGNGGEIGQDANATKGPARWVFVATPPTTDQADPDQADRATRPETLPWEEAWQRARQRAGDALAGGRLPSQYRELIERYYERPDAR